MNAQLESQAENLRQNQLLLDIGGGLLCTICTTVAGIAKSMIGAGADVVIPALNDACLVTLFLAGPCQDFVNRDVRQMLQLLSRHIPVEQVCHLLKVCSDSQLQQLNRLI